VKQCGSCEFNEAGFCLASLEYCKSIKLKSPCKNYMNKETNWDIDDSPYQEYGELYKDWMHGQLK
jgi:hypothetical protein